MNPEREAKLKELQRARLAAYERQKRNERIRSGEEEPSGPPTYHNPLLEQLVARLFPQAVVVVPVWSDREIEPKLITGHGPTGVPDGPGRGPLSLRQETRLGALHGFWLLGHMD